MANFSLVRSLVMDRYNDSAELFWAWLHNQVDDERHRQLAKQPFPFVRQLFANPWRQFLLEVAEEADEVVEQAEVEDAYELGLDNLAYTTAVQVRPTLRRHLDQVITEQIDIWSGEEPRHWSKRW